MKLSEIEEDRIKCLLCPHGCSIKKGNFGFCGVRYNNGDKITIDDYPLISALSNDPIEKKPLYHFYPGENIFSIGGYGCNLKCPYCQNFSISQKFNPSRDNGILLSPLQVVKKAKENNSNMIAFTYSEPIVIFEYVLEMAKIAKENKLSTVMVSNGMINVDPLKELAKYIDAWNIDLKTFNENCFKKFHKGYLKTVKETIAYVASNSHLEITTLAVTGINDNEKDYSDIINFISEINNDIPFHISRYYPSYKYNQEPSSIRFLNQMCDLASKKLNYVYSGNYKSPLNYENTYCPKCQSLLIKRNGYFTEIISLQKGLCRNCGYEIYGKFRS